MCYDGWLYWNGYIPTNRINSHDANGRPNGSWEYRITTNLSRRRLFRFLRTAAIRAIRIFGFYDTNTVYVPLNNGTVQRTTMDTGLHPLQNQYFAAPIIWNMAGSLFKSFPITERVVLRVNADFLNNLFNMPGDNVPQTDGLLINRNSANPARVLQLTMRLTW